MFSGTPLHQADYLKETTPADQTPRSATPVPFHEQLGADVTWVNDWYALENAHLKGWVKTNINHKEIVKPEPHDVVDLSQWRYT